MILVTGGVPRPMTPEEVANHLQFIKDCVDPGMWHAPWFWTDGRACSILPFTAFVTLAFSAWVAFGVYAIWCYYKKT